jgi:hypothetical protein
MRFLLLFLAGTTALWGASLHDANWGASASEVETIEGRNADNQSENEMIFKGKFGENEVYRCYRFNEKGLAMSRYLFPKQQRDSSVYVSQYKEIDALLARKYGPSTSQKVSCDDDFYRDYPARWGMGIVSGKLTMETKWETPDFDIRHAIYTLPQGATAHVVEYTPPSQPASAVNGFEAAYEDL